MPLPLLVLPQDRDCPARSPPAAEAATSPSSSSPHRRSQEAENGYSRLTPDSTVTHFPSLPPAAVHKISFFLSLFRLGGGNSLAVAGWYTRRKSRVFPFQPGVPRAETGPDSALDGRRRRRKRPLLPCCNMAWLHDLFGAACAKDSPEKNESPEPVDLAEK